MLKNWEIFLFVWCILLVVTSSTKNEKKASPNKVVFYAFSGLRWDANMLTDMPSIQRIKNNGVWVKRKVDAFQTESLPSFVSMSTGKYPDEHGFVSNVMRNDRGENFDVSQTNKKWWGKIKPFWVDLMKLKNETSALCYWPGYDVTYDKFKVKYECSDKKFVDPFKGLILKNELGKKVMPFEQRNDYVKHWLQSNNTKQQPPSFIGVYFEEPFATMMKYGVHSKQTKEALKRVDKTINNMLDWLKNQNLDKTVNFIVAGESGVTDLHDRQEIFLDDFLKKNMTSVKYEVIDKGPITTVHVKDNRTVQDLLKIWRGNRNFEVYSKDQIPKNFHFMHKSHTSSITVSANEHWRIYKSRIQLKFADNKKSMMGYDGKYESTHALFVAQGPSFKENKIFARLQNVEVHSVLCKLFNISSKRNSSIVDEMMKAEEKWFEHIVHKIVDKITESPKYFVLAVVLTAFLLFVAVFLIISAIYKATNCCRKCCCGYPMKVKVPSPRKMLTKRKNEIDEHLLSDKDLSDSDLSSSDDFYFSKQSNRLKK